MDTEFDGAVFLLDGSACILEEEEVLLLLLFICPWDIASCSNGGDPRIDIVIIKTADKRQHISGIFNVISMLQIDVINYYKRGSIAEYSLVY
jgi:hypothetical protein